MIDLLKLKCKEPAPGEVAMGDEEIQRFLPLVQDWKVIEREGNKQLERTFIFKDFMGALTFSNQVGKLAEEENHHPTILFTWGRTTVSWRTHKVNGLSLNDFIMAAKTDEAFEQMK